LQKNIHQRPIHGSFVHDDLLVPLLFPQLGRSQFHSVQRALARQGGALIADPPPILPRQILLLHQHRQQRVAQARLESLEFRSFRSLALWSSR
jgi:hypothetical protein